MNNILLLILIISFICYCSQKKPSSKSEVVTIDGEEYRLNYYDDGTLKSKIGLVDGQENGFGFIYYKSGRINHMVYWSNGKILGHQYSYYDLANSNSKMAGPLKEYAFLEDNGEFSFSCGFESDGALGYKKGSLIVAYDINISDNNEEFYYMLQYAHLPVDSMYSKLIVYNDTDTLINNTIRINKEYLTGIFTVLADLPEDFYLQILTFYEMKNATLRDTTYLLRAKPRVNSNS